jgi:hypothetical protein
MKLTRQSVLAASTLVIGGFIGASALVAFATSVQWTQAPANPPSCDNSISGCNAPLNVSGAAQTKSGILGLSNLQFLPASMITTVNGVATGNVPAGSVLTAADNSGTVKWAPAGSGSGSTYNFISPISLMLAGVSGSVNCVPWTTVNVSSYFPAGTKDVIVQGYMGESSPDGIIGTFFLGRKDSSQGSDISTSYIITGSAASAGSDGSAGGGQAIIPLSASGTFDYALAVAKVSNNAIVTNTSTGSKCTDLASLQLIGYIGPSGSVSSLNTSGFACYYKVDTSNPFSNPHLNEDTYTFTGSATGGLSLTYTLVRNGAPNTNVTAYVPGVDNINDAFQEAGSYTIVSSADGQTANVSCTSNQ